MARCHQYIRSHLGSKIGTLVVPLALGLHPHTAGILAHQLFKWLARGLFHGLLDCGVLLTFGNLWVKN